MTQRKSKIFTLAAVLALVNAVLHIASAALDGFSSAAMPMLVASAIWLVFAIGLFAKQRWLAYFAFVFSIIAALTIYANLGSDSSMSYWIQIAMAALAVLSILVLFVLIWRRSGRLQSSIG